MEPTPAPRTEASSFFDFNAGTTKGSYAIDLFPPGHPLHDLKAPTLSSLRGPIEGYDLSYVFYTDKYDTSRGGVRPGWGTLFGRGAELDLPTAPAYLLTPGKNRMFVEVDTDPTVIRHMEEIGVLTPGATVVMKSFEHMNEILVREGRKVYSMDGLPPSFDSHSMNSARDFDFVSNKLSVPALTNYAPTQVIIDMRDPKPEDFERVWKPGHRVYIKCCNTEAGSLGVKPVERTDYFDEAWKRFQSIVAEENKRREQWNLAPELVLQTEINPPGSGVKNRSMQILIDRGSDEIQVVGLSLQLNGPDGCSYAGNINLPITRETVEPVGPAIQDLVRGIKRNCPDASGFVMCDFFEIPGSSPILYDPGLRTTASTPAAAARLWVQETYGRDVAIACFTMLNFNEPGLHYSDVVKRLGEFGTPDSISRTGYGVLPYGHNQVSGIANVMLVTPTADDFTAFYRSLKEQLAIND